MSVQGSISFAATVLEDDLSFNGEPSSFIDQSNSEIFTDYLQFNRYEKDSRRYMMGVASPSGFQGKTVAFVQLASPTLLWVCDWTTAKSGAQPEIPDPNPPDSNWVLLHEYPETANLVIYPDGRTPLYRVSGIYVYGHMAPDANTFKNVVFPRPPWLKDTFDRTIPLAKLTAGLSAPGTGGTGSSIGKALEIPYPPTGIKT